MSRPSFQPQHELTLSQLQRMFDGAKSMAIVGSASSVKNVQGGAAIDACDIVVRFNRATTNGLEPHVGSRTDILVANEANSLKKGKRPEETSCPKCVVTYIKTPSLKPSGKWREAYFEWLGCTPVFLSTGPEILCCDTPHRKRGFSMGTYAVASLPHWLGVEHLHVTGFTMFGEGPGGSHHYSKSPSRVAETWHDAVVEAKVFASVLAALPCKLTTTDEVARLMKQQGFTNPNAADLPAMKTIVNHSLQRTVRYLLGRGSKGLLTLGYGLRRVAERP